MATSESSDGVPLLSGGNPQVPKGDGDGPVQTYLAAMPGWKGDIGRHVDGLVREVVPDVRTAVRWNSPFYGVEGNGWFLSMHCFTNYVQLTWLNGSELDSPPAKTSKHERVRYLDIGEHDEIDDNQLRGWIRGAAELAGEDMF